MTTISHWLQPPRKWAKARWLQLRGRFVQTFLSYDESALKAAVVDLGLHPGDDVMVHAAFGSHHGFRGNAQALTDVFIDAVGPEGHVLMVSLPYLSSSLAYLEGQRRFDVRHTPSMMGLVSEFFRRRPEVRRSLHPTHPMLVRGPKADWYVAGHEECRHPCGFGTPFDKFLERDGLVLFFNVPFATFTFFHYLEHLVSPDLPFALYTQPPHQVTVIDAEGRPRTVTTHVFTLDAIRRRRFPVLEAELRERGLIAGRRIGNTRIEAVRVRAVVDCVQEMRRQGRYFYDLSPLPDAHPPG